MFKPSNHVANPDDGYELDDVKTKVILISGIVMTVLTLVAYGVGVIYGKVLTRDDRSVVTQYEPSYTSDELDGHNAWESEVRLQPNPVLALSQHRTAQHAVSKSWGTVSESPKIYRIPLDVALDHVVETGLPVWEPTETQE
jgi:hypothetical protein